MKADFDPKDFERNPEKYKLFKTARIAETIKSASRLYEGRMVKIRHFDNKINVARGKATMPVYAVKTDDDDEETYVYACALRDFCM